MYRSILKHADAFPDLLDALTVAGQVESPVALSEEQPFCQKFGSIFDPLRQCDFDFDLFLNHLRCHQPANSETIAGYEVCAVDYTPNARIAAETLEDRRSLKTQKDEPVRYGHKNSWLARLIHCGSSWGLHWKSSGWKGIER